VKLEYLMTYHADLKPPVDVGAGPFGTRQIFDVIGGTFEGPKLRGTFVPSGADWILVGPDGVGRLDVRGTMKTDDGAHIYVQYYGVIEIAAAAQKVAAGGSTDFGEIYFMTAPRLETGDPRYAWLNRAVCVGEGRFGPGWVEYRVYQVTNG
jgi:hypothetical protein